MTKCDFNFLTRKKKFDDESVSTSGLRRVMGVLDVTAIGLLEYSITFFIYLCLYFNWYENKLKGISSTLGSGIYVLSGSVSHLDWVFVMS